MKVIKQTLCLLLLTTASYAKITVEAELSGITDVNLAQKRIYDDDCYPGGKGSRWTPMGRANLPLQGGVKLLENGNMEWGAAMTQPFPRHIRTTKISVNTTAQQLKESVSIQLTDNFGHSFRQYQSEKCHHDDGYATTERSEIEGSVKVEYTVPSNVWIIQIERSGTGVLHRENMVTIQGALNDGSDVAGSSTEIIWVKPGSKITQEIRIKKQISIANSVSTATVSFNPVGDISTDELSSLRMYLDQYPDLAKNSGADFSAKAKLMIKYVGAILLDKPEVNKELASKSSQNLSALSKQFFTTANQTFTSAELGLAVKTAAALASYEIANRLLQDVSKYCESVEVYLPLSDKTVKTMGLKAAGFWLTRGLSNIKNYRFDEYEVFLTQLVALESSGATYAQVTQDKATIAKIQKAYDLLTDTMDVGASPFGATLRDVNRTINKFGSLGSKDGYAQELIQDLKTLDKLEQKFVVELFASLDLFSTKSQEIVRGTQFAKQLQNLKATQARISNDMAKNINLLSVDNASDVNSLMHTMTDLLSNQIAIFEEPLKNVPYFERVREAYLQTKNTGATIKKVKACITGGVQ